MAMVVVTSPLSLLVNVPDIFLVGLVVVAVVVVVFVGVVVVVVADAVEVECCVAVS